MCRKRRTGALPALPTIFIFDFRFSIRAPVAEKKSNPLSAGRVWVQVPPGAPFYSYSDLEFRICFGFRSSSFGFIKSHRRTLPGLVSCVSPALMKQPSGLSARSVAANALGLGPRDRRCKSCRADHFRNGMMDGWICGLVNLGPLSHYSNYLVIQHSISSAAVAEIDEAFVS
jgi:hypothetical protein